MVLLRHLCTHYPVELESHKDPLQEVRNLGSAKIETLFWCIHSKSKMPLFNETIESIAQAIVTVKRALKAGVIEKENYKELEDYLNQRAKDLKLKKSHVAEAKLALDDKLKSEVEEFFMKQDDALYKWAEELLEDFNGDKEDEEFSKWSEKIFEDFKAADIEEDVDVCDIWAKMNNKERAAMAALASKWEKNR